VPRHLRNVHSLLRVDLQAGPLWSTERAYLGTGNCERQVTDERKCTLGALAAVGRYCAGQPAGHQPNAGVSDVPQPA
jgi:hypothetical protein